MAGRPRRSLQATLAALALAVAFYALTGEWPGFAPSEPARELPAASAPAAPPPVAAPERFDDAVVERAFRERRSDLWVELAGTVEKKLRDDRDGSRHQKFILRLASGRTLLVAHNIDLADRVPLARGDTVLLRGEYEWNERGGVVHWTHHDPEGRREGGWIEHGGQRYE
ncbi:MAG: DUF3465 domain-containing protein [Myxococcota bacterium]